MLAAGSPVIAAYLALRYFSGKSRPGWRERWGHLPPGLARKENGCPRLWIHAVSVGEVVAAVPILRELRARLPRYELVFSVITPFGREVAEQQAAPFVDAIFYFPFDLPWVARRVVRAVRPDVFVSLESEMWPNLLHELKRQGARTVLVNGRISERTFQRQMAPTGKGRIGRAFYRWMLTNMDSLLMQSDADDARIRILGGGLNEPGRVAVVGNSKFDQDIARLTPDETRALRRSLRLPPDAPVFVAGSVRSLEETAQVVAAYKIMRAEFAELCLLIAPRQLDMADGVADLMRQAGLTPQRRTQLLETDAPAHHVILDTMGELARVYAVASLVFVGNSFAPVKQGGGQNLLQPLAHGKPVLFGPLTATIRAEVALALAAGVGFEVADGETLAAEGLRLLHNKGLRANLEVRALALIAANRGVSARYAAAIVDLANQAARTPQPARAPKSRRATPENG